jgi:motility quorum-sensing regulator / GCU-specific mRNA interferase toxin
LRQGAGEKAPLKRKGYFARRPYLHTRIDTAKCIVNRQLWSCLAILPLKGNIAAVTEKLRPQYDLTLVKQSVARRGAASFTKTALDGGRAMGLTTLEMLTVIETLSRSDFYKSMTTYESHKVWQDVYHADTPVERTAYIKITLFEDRAPVIQFKEK